MRRFVDRLSPAAWMTLTALLVLAVVTAKWLLPWLTRDESVRVATPVPPALVQVAEVRVPPGQELCVNNVVFPKEAAAISMAGRTLDGKPGPALTVTADGEDWRARSVIEPGWQTVLATQLGRPPKDVLAAICLTNTGRQTVIVNGNPDPAKLNGVQATLDGKPITGAPELELREAELRSRLARAGFMIGRAAELTWRPLAGWSVTVIALLALALTLVVGVGATAWSMARDDDAAPEPGDGENPA